MSDGVVLYEGPSELNGDPIVCVATGLGRPSTNRATGPMVQVWIMPADCSPLEAIRNGKDFAVCGDCNLRPCRKGGCYVSVLVHGPQRVWRRWKRGGYRKGSVQSVEGKRIRLGAWGDPRALPLSLVKALCGAARKHTGYTHLWSWRGSYRYRGLLMASVESESQARAAKKRSWRTFRVRPEGGELLAGEKACLKETGVQCIDCCLCNGTEGARCDLSVPVHGYQKEKVFA